MTRRLSDIMEEFISVLTSQGSPKTSVNTARTACNKLLLEVGNLQIGNITDRHIDSLFAAQAQKGLQPQSLNTLRTQLRGLFAYAMRRGYIKQHRSPIAHIKPFKVMPKEKLRIPPQKFPALLDAAPHPRDRILTAIGLYLFLRASEAQLLRIGWVNLDAGEIHVEIPKTRQVDVMPISRELDRELRRWFRFYAEDVQAGLKPDWYLIPGKAAPRPTYDEELRRWTAKYGERGLKPSRPMANVAETVRRSLRAAGYPDRFEDGKPAYEGMHTLRRSGARALFDRLASEGYDGAIRETQAWLHHSSSSMTERYLGITLDVKRRNDNTRGKWMFPESDENVISMVRSE